jgi:hypothetical protein
VHTTRYWNNLHQVRSKPNNYKIMLIFFFNCRYEFLTEDIKWKFLGHLTKINLATLSGIHVSTWLRFYVLVCYLGLSSDIDLILMVFWMTIILSFHWWRDQTWQRPQLPMWTKNFNEVQYIYLCITTIRYHTTKYRYDLGDQRMQLQLSSACLHE